ncbi:S8 family serine peptidase [Clostridium sp. Cult2]|uniref:S8 family serine peptidase n=1 Tax=Clostridium sp. Cult2 TaxID=2079003 RepID=UPI001F01A2F9|nr:S8 family serine peptidase [Clostridium sp. Cult2]MCF6465305.1 lactocepin [Clostridium sp. Cult2]
MMNKKLLSIVLVLILLLSTFTTVLAAPNREVLESLRSSVRKPAGEMSISIDSKTKGLTDSDEVRVFVELEDNPIIEYATARGVKVNELDKEIRKQMKKELLAEQKRMKEYLKTNGIKMKELKNFVNVINGFSITTTFGEAKFIERMPGVNRVSLVNEYHRPVPEMVSSKDIVNARETWTKLGYDGEGMVVAIIDTGIDPSHRDMVLTNSENAKLQEGYIENLVRSEEYPGQWHTIKVPYGYNYMDENQEILDLGPDASEHGMHVAGIVGANGNEENDGIKGIAPESQLLAMKVFGNNPAMPSTFGDVIVKAIDDSVALGADVINMSLGSTASFVMEDDLEQLAVKRAMENGVICAISAGNSAQFGYGWDDPYAKNPDIGVVGAPGISVESIQVASIENTHMTTTALEYLYNGVQEKAGYARAGSLNPVSIFTGPVEYVNCNLGAIEDFTDVDVAGKIALIQRGGLTFVEKITNAQDNGAIGVIVYNNESGGEGLVNMQYPEDGRIPAVFIQLSHGLRLVEIIETIQNFVEFRGNTTVVPNPDTGKMSEFTSWGTTPNLDFKPEITAPGGNIWSTAQKDGYQLMSGTSMAAPHVAGGAAVVLQRVDEEFGLTGNERVEMAKNLIMSTAHPLGDKGLYNDYFGLSGYNFTSPRRQGAGVMDIYAAATTPSIVVDSSTGLSKVNLDEIGDYTNFTVTVENFSEETVSYKVKGTVQTDLTDGDYNFLETQGVYIDGTIEDGMGPNGLYSGDFPISFDEEIIEVPAGGSGDFNVYIDLSNAVDWYYNAPLNAIFPNGTFIEGFVTLEDVNDTNPTLNIPYIGFYGRWDEAPIIDDTNYDEDGTPFYGVTTMTWLDEAAGTYYFLGYDAEGNPDANNIAFSPNADGVADSVVPVLSFLRNARELNINILDESGSVVRELYKGEFMRKNYHNARYPIYTSYDLWAWDGTINNRLADDGQYYYEINARVDYPGAKWQTLTFPVKIDTALPVVEEIVYNEETKEFIVAASDGKNPIYLYRLVEKGEVIAESLDGIFDLSEVDYSHKSLLLVQDFAGNVTVEKLEFVFKGEKGEKDKKDKGKEESQNPEEPNQFEEPVDPAEGDETIPTVMVTEPEFFGIYNRSNIVIKGYINDKSSIESFKINGVDVPITWNGQTGNWDFETEVTLEDGYHSINVEAIDSAGNHIAFAHKIFVDTIKPVIDITSEVPPSTESDVLLISGIITDNLPSLRVMINGNMIENISPDWSYFDTLPPAKYELNYEIQLEDGKNIIIIEAEDDVGNVERLEFKINKIKAGKGNNKN